MTAQSPTRNGRTAAVDAQDSERFGVLVARAADVSEAQVEALLAWCEREGVEVLIARCPTSRLDAVHQMEANGFRLMGCLLVYEHSLEEVPDLHPVQGIELRPARMTDTRQVEAVARQAFRSHGGHYHVDPRLDHGPAIEVYASWAGSAVRNDNETSSAIVATDGDRVVGFVTASEVGTERPVGGVAAVSREHQGRGIYRALVTARLHQLRRAGAESTVVSADVVNPASQNCWTSLGYRLIRSDYTFHRWMSP